MKARIFIISRRGQLAAVRTAMLTLCAFWETRHMTTVEIDVIVVFVKVKWPQRMGGARKVRLGV